MSNMEEATVQEARQTIAEQAAFDGDSLTQALDDELGRVRPLAKDASKLKRFVASWAKAAEDGDLSQRQKVATQARDLAEELCNSIVAASSQWSFDEQAYLSSHRWRDELEAEGARDGAFRAFVDGDTLLVPPVVLRALPANKALRIGKARTSRLRPSVVAAHLKNLRERMNLSASTEFLESLHQVARTQDSGERNPLVKFSDAYNTFCIAPGYRRENPKADFGLAIHALHLSGLQSTRAGIPFQFEWPAANCKESEVFTVVAEDGKPLRYFGIQFIR